MLNVYLRKMYKVCSAGFHNLKRSISPLENKADYFVDFIYGGLLYYLLLSYFTIFLFYCDFRCELDEEKTHREALRKKSIVPYFHPENFSLYQVLSHWICCVRVLDAQVVHGSLKDRALSLACPEFAAEPGVRHGGALRQSSTDLQDQKGRGFHEPCFSRAQCVVLKQHL